MSEKVHRPKKIKIIAIVLICLGLLSLVLNLVSPDPNTSLIQRFAGFFICIIIGLGLIFAFRVAWFLTIIFNWVCIFEVPYNLSEHPNNASSLVCGVGLLIGCSVVLLSEESLQYFKFNSKSKIKLILISFVLSLVSFELLRYAKAF